MSLAELFPTPSEAEYKAGKQFVQVLKSEGDVYPDPQSLIFSLATRILRTDPALVDRAKAAGLTPISNSTGTSQIREVTKIEVREVPVEKIVVKEVPASKSEGTLLLEGFQDGQITQRELLEFLGLNDTITLLNLRDDFAMGRISGEDVLNFFGINPLDCVEVTINRKSLPAGVQTIYSPTLAPVTQAPKKTRKAAEVSEDTTSTPKKRTRRSKSVITDQDLADLNRSTFQRLVINDAIDIVSNDTNLRDAFVMALNETIALGVELPESWYEIGAENASTITLNNDRSVNVYAASTMIVPRVEKLVSLFDMGGRLEFLTKAGEPRTITFPSKITLE